MTSRAILHRAKNLSDTGSWVVSARCVKIRQRAESSKNMNKNNRPTEAHRALFYLAILRSCFLRPISASSSRIRWRAIPFDRSHAPSSRL